MIKGLIFDFDGLILDTERPELVSWQETYQEEGCYLPLERWALAIGAGYANSGFDPYAYLEAQLGRPVDRAAVRARHRQRYAEMIKTEEIRPGVQAYLADARRLGLRLGVASSSSREWVAGHLERLGLLSHFDCLRCSGDVAHTKPEPDVYLAVLAEWGLPAERVIAFEDSPNGLAAARRAGIICVAVPNAVTAQLSLEEADLRLESLAELPLEELLRRLDGHSTG